MTEGSRVTVHQRQDLFRKRALESYLDRHSSANILRASPPWAWSLFWVVVVVVVSALVLSIFGRVELTTVGRGILRQATGVRALSTQTSGVVVEVLAHSGQYVRRGQAVLRLDSAPLRGELLESDRQIAMLEREIDRFTRGQSQYIARQSESRRTTIESLRSQIRSLDETIAAKRIRYQGDVTLEKAGLLSKAAVAESREAVAVAERQKQAVTQQLTQAEKEASSIDFSSETDRASREEELRTAVARREAVQLSLEQLTVPAPIDGYLEAVLVKAGDVLPTGAPVGKLIPAAGPLQVVSFVPERDRAFINPGDRVQIELEQLPYAEFGSLSGRVRRVSHDLASRYEVKDAFGDESTIQGPTYRVELTLDPPARPLPLRPGMLLNVRYTLRRQRVITLLFEPLARWFR